MTNWTAMGPGNGRGWYLAPSLVALGNEINARWPNRDTSSDGAIGDASHQARKSDHNPDWDAGGVVRAIDVDKDGIVVSELLAAVVRDPRVAYVIWNKRIASATDDGTPWDWEPYNGPNDHTHHIHISIKHTRTAERDTSRWFTETEAHPLSDLTDADAAKIGAAVAEALAPVLTQQTAAEYAGDQKLVVADNNYDSQRAAYEAVGAAEAAHILAGGTPHTAGELKTAFNAVWSYYRPLWGAK